MDDKTLTNISSSGKMYSVQADLKANHVEECVLILRESQLLEKQKATVISICNLAI